MGADGGGQGIDGFVVRMNACSKQSDYGNHNLGVQLENEGSNCRRNYKWATRIGTIGRYDSTNWVAESPDGQYIIIVGATNIAAGNKRYIARVVTKMRSLDGNIIWSVTLPTTDNLGEFKNSGYESVAFSSDGGFIVSGFTNWPADVIKATDGPMLKSGGQLEEGYPIVEKFPPSIANADTINENDFVLGNTL